MINIECSSNNIRIIVGMDEFTTIHPLIKKFLLVSRKETIIRYICSSFLCKFGPESSRVNINFDRSIEFIARLATITTASDFDGIREYIRNMLTQWHGHKIMCHSCNNQTKTENIIAIARSSDIAFFCKDCIDGYTFLKCENCDNAVIKYDCYHAISAGANRPYCGTCAGNLTKSCDNCGNRHLTSDLIRMGSYLVCPRCASSMAPCKKCGKPVVNGRRHSFPDEDGEFCSRCFNDIKAVSPLCGKCGCVFYHPLSMVVVHREYMCKSCNNELSKYDTSRYLDNLLLKRYSCKLRVKSDSSPDILYGVELEAEAQSHIMKRGKVLAGLHDTFNTDDFHAENRKFVTKRDGSLDDNHGFELVLRPMSLEVLSTTLSNMVSFLKDCGCTTPSSCGMHIHVGMEKVSEIEARTIASFICQNGSLIKRVSGRPFNTFCSIDDVISAAPSISTNHHAAWCYGSGQSTYEMRTFDSTLDVNELLPRLEFMDAMIYFCKDLGKPRESTLMYHKAFFTWLIRQDRYINLKKFFVMDIEQNGMMKGSPRRRAQLFTQCIEPTQSKEKDDIDEILSHASLTWDLGGGQSRGPSFESPFTT